MPGPGARWRGVGGWRGGGIQPNRARASVRGSDGLIMEDMTPAGAGMCGRARRGGTASAGGRGGVMPIGRKKTLQGAPLSNEVVEMSASQSP